MDFFAHGFWSYILFHNTKKPWIAVFFGLLPDLTSWFIFAIYNIMTKGHLGEPNVANIPDWTFRLYNISHSLIIALVVIGVVYIILKKMPWYMLAWPFHIIVDVPTHTRSFLPTPFLWPLSNWSFPGISWADWRFMFFNYILIVSLLSYIMWKKWNSSTRKKN